jgi:hypothetical protein
MKTIRSLKSKLSLLTLVGSLVAANAAHAATNNYLIDINTAAIANNAAGPYYLDLQSIWGSGATQTFNVSSITLTGGNFITGTDVSSGAGVSVGAGPTLSFDTSTTNSFNEWYQQFDASVTDVKLNVSSTINGVGATPTEFAVSILDNNLNNVPTTALYGDTLAAVNVTGLGATLQTATSLDGGITVTAAAIPEPAVAASLMGAGALALVTLRRRTRAVPAQSV